MGWSKWFWPVKLFWLRMVSTCRSHIFLEAFRRTNEIKIEKQLLAVHFAIKHWRPYIYGWHFVVQSDHKPLIYLYNLKKPNSKLYRIRLEIEEYDFENRYIKGKLLYIITVFNVHQISSIFSFFGWKSIFILKLKL